MPELSALRLVNLRLVKVPDAAPPYDCQVHGARCPAGAGPAVAGTADVPPAVLAPPSGAPPVVAPPVVGSAAVASPVVGSAAVAPPRVAGVAGVAGDLTTAWPRQLAAVIVEVLAGVRPDRQLVALATAFGQSSHLARTRCGRSPAPVGFA